MAARRPRVCFERLLPRDLMRAATTVRGPDGRFSAIAPIGKAWMNGSTLRVRFIGGTPAQHAVVKREAGWWQAAANIKFVFDDAPNAEIRIPSTPAMGPGHSSAPTAAVSPSTNRP